jgi:hypothetical protein
VRWQVRSRWLGTVWHSAPRFGGVAMHRNIGSGARGWVRVRHGQGGISVGLLGGARGACSRTWQALGALPRTRRRALPRLLALHHSPYGRSAQQATGSSGWLRVSASQPARKTVLGSVSRMFNLGRVTQVARDVENFSGFFNTSASCVSSRSRRALGLWELVTRIRLHVTDFWIIFFVI